MYEGHQKSLTSHTTRRWPWVPQDLENSVASMIATCPLLLQDVSVKKALASPWRESAGPGARKGKLTPLNWPIMVPARV